VTRDLKVWRSVKSLNSNSLLWSVHLQSWILNLEWHVRITHVRKVIQESHNSFPCSKGYTKVLLIHSGSDVVIFVITSRSSQARRLVDQIVAPVSGQTKRGTCACASREPKFRVPRRNLDSVIDTVEDRSLHLSVALGTWSKFHTSHHVLSGRDKRESYYVSRIRRHVSESIVIECMNLNGKPWVGHMAEMSHQTSMRLPLCLSVLCCWPQKINA
jgi:hypothetical protein